MGEVLLPLCGAGAGGYQLMRCAISYWASWVGLDVGGPDLTTLEFQIPSSLNSLVLPSPPLYLISHVAVLELFPPELSNVVEISCVPHASGFHRVQTPYLAQYQPSPRLKTKPGTCSVPFPSLSEPLALGVPVGQALVLPRNQMRGGHVASRESLAQH